MTTKEELIKAWETISQFCEEQEECSKCHLTWCCHFRFETKRLETLASKFARQISEDSLNQE